MGMISLLRVQNIKPVIVFDGQKLPAKSQVNSQRDRYISFLFLSHCHILYCTIRFSYLSTVMILFYIILCPINLGQEINL